MMRKCKIHVALLILCLIVLGPFIHVTAANGTGGVAEPNSSDKEGWRLTFEDNFEGDQLDLSKWSHLPEWQRKDGYWSHQEAFLDGKGHLIIQVIERDGKYYSGAITTKGKFEQTHGFYEIRAQLPKEEGFWTAFWLMTDGAHRVGDGGRDGTEIDIFESPFSTQDRIQHALHWDGYETHHQSAGHAPHIPGIYEGFHTFALEWNEDVYIFYIDGEETWRTSAGGVSQVPSWVQITAEVGQWGGDIRKANLPTQLVVDYVRVYERIHKITIDRPSVHETVSAGSPVKFQVDPDIDIYEVTVTQNDTEIYRGPCVPDGLTLGIPVKENREEHRITVRVTDTEGNVFERSRPFVVQRLALDLGETDTGRLHGLVPVKGIGGFGPKEKVIEAKLTLQPIRAFEETEAILLYVGNTLPNLSVDTAMFEDGAYDLRLTVKTDQDTEASVVHRVVIRNWSVFTESFAPPVEFFGITVDGLKTTDRSDGWLFLSQDEHAFFGDSQRVAWSGPGTGFLTWKHPNLRKFVLTLYAKDASLDDKLMLAASSGAADWHTVDYVIEPTGQSESGWLRLRLSGDIPESWEADHFQVTVSGNVPADGDVQLGSLELIGLSND